MNIVRDFLNTLLHYDYSILPNIRLMLVIYSVVFLILFLENAILPAVFLPGDSLLIILGILIEKGILDFFITLSVLTIAASLGSWISYLQGKFLENNKFTQRWLSRLPHQVYQKVHYMFMRHGLFALFIGRFIVFFRTILPTIAGLSGLRFFYFQIFNWSSAFLWVLILISFGCFLERFNFLNFLNGL